MPRKKRSEKTEARRFAVILAIILLGFAGLSWWKAHPGRATGLAIAAGIVPIIAFAAFPLWLKFFRLWMKFAEVLSWVMTRVILTVFFFGILTPVGLVMKLFGKAPMDLKWKDGRETYWFDKGETEYTVERYSKQF